MNISYNMIINNNKEIKGMIIRFISLKSMYNVIRTSLIKIIIHIYG